MTTIIQAKTCIYDSHELCRIYRCCRTRCLIVISRNDIPLYKNNRFLPYINLVMLPCFVAEVR